MDIQNRSNKYKIIIIQVVASEKPLARTRILTLSNRVFNLTN